VDGVVFVADSMEVRREKNVLSLKDLHQNLKEYGLSILKIPLVLQFNKRDLEKEGIPLMPVDQMEKELNRQLKVPTFTASALSGEGVGKTLQACLKLTLQSLKQELNWDD
jgi:signal recognition particle receptor subunit beta